MFESLPFSSLSIACALDLQAAAASDALGSQAGRNMVVCVNIEPRPELL